MPLSGINRTVTWAMFNKLNGADTTEDKDEAAKINPEIIVGKFTLKRVGPTLFIKDVNLELIVLRETSWVWKGYETDSLLEHERYHYKIAAIGAKQLYKEFKATSAADAADLQIAAGNIKSSITKIMQEKSDLYDVETDHNRLFDPQQKWQRKIDIVFNDPNGKLEDLL